MKKKLVILVIVSVLISSIFILTSCGNNYKFSFNANDIKEIAVVSRAFEEDVVLTSQQFGEFYNGLKSLNYKSYMGQIKGQESRSIKITLKNGNVYTFESYFIFKNGKRILKYKCDVEKFNDFLDKYAPLPERN